jgi:hypothetical protein
MNYHQLFVLCIIFTCSFIRAGEEKSLSELVAINNIDPKTLSISIDKSDYQLTILSSKTAIKTYTVD